MGFRKITIFPCNILVLHKLSSCGLKENHLSRNEKLTDENRDIFEGGGGGEWGATSHEHALLSTIWSGKGAGLQP